MRYDINFAIVIMNELVVQNIVIRNFESSGQKDVMKMKLDIGWYGMDFASTSLVNGHEWFVDTLAKIFVASA